VYAMHAEPRDEFRSLVCRPRDKLAGAAGIAVQTARRQLAIGRGSMAQGVSSTAATSNARR
jgi:hypothetical protein